MRYGKTKMWKFSLRKIKNSKKKVYESENAGLIKVQ